MTEDDIDDEVDQKTIAAIRKVYDKVVEVHTTGLSDLEVYLSKMSEKAWQLALEDIAERGTPHEIEFYAVFDTILDAFKNVE